MEFRALRVDLEHDIIVFNFYIEAFDCDIEVIFPGYLDIKIYKLLYRSHDFDIEVNKFDIGYNIWTRLQSEALCHPLYRSHDFYIEVKNFDIGYYIRRRLQSDAPWPQISKFFFRCRVRYGWSGDGAGGAAGGGAAEEQQVLVLHAQAAADAVEMRKALLAVADAVRVLAAGAAVGAEAGVGGHLAAVAGVHASVGGGGSSGGGG